MCFISWGNLKIPNRYKEVNIEIRAQIKIKTSRFKIPQWETKSAFDKNFKANANSINPITIFVVFNQVPDLGIDCNAFGNRENIPKGKDKDNPKPIIPKDSSIAPASDDNDPARSEPKIGPVQEKETIAKVNAIKNNPIIPFNLKDALSEKFDHFDGRDNS